jgi:PKD repeat protein
MHQMKLISRIAALVCLLILSLPTSNAHAQPVAGITVTDINTLSGLPDNYFRLQLANNATGNSGTCQYFVTSVTGSPYFPGSILTQWTSGNVSTTNHDVPFGGPCRIWQVVSNGSLYDTTYVDTLISCSTISNPLNFSTTYSVYGPLIVVAGIQTTNCEGGAVVVSHPQGGIVIIEPQMQHTSDTVSFPGPYTYCVDWYWCTCPTNFQTCDTLYVPCWRPPLVNTSFVLADSLASFSSSVFGSNAPQYSWDFGDGSPLDSSASPTHTYANGSYTACLTVTDSCGSSTSCQTVLVGPVGLQAGPIQAVQMAPNPNNGQFQVSFDAAETGLAAMRVRDMHGRRLYTQDVAVRAGVNRVGIALALPKGVYLLELELQDGRKHHQRMAVE